MFALTADAADPVTDIASKRHAPSEPNLDQQSLWRESLPLRTGAARAAVPAVSRRRLASSLTAVTPSMMPPDFAQHEFVFVVNSLLQHPRGATGPGGTSRTVAVLTSGWVREWLIRRAGHQGVEPATLD